MTLKLSSFIPKRYVDIAVTNALDKAFVIVANHYACPTFKDLCDITSLRRSRRLAAYMNKGTADAKGKMDPKWSISCVHTLKPPL